MQWIGRSCPTSTRESNGHRGAAPASADGFDREKRTGPRRMARGLPPTGRARGTSGRGPGKGVLADTRWGDGWWVYRQFQMLEDLPDDRALRDGGDDPQCPPLAERAARHVQGKHPLEQPRPAPAWRPRVRRLLVDTLLAGRRDDGPVQVAVRRQAP